MAEVFNIIDDRGVEVDIQRFQLRQIFRSERSCIFSTQSSNEFSADIPLRKLRSGVENHPDSVSSVSLERLDRGTRLELRRKV